MKKVMLLVVALIAFINSNAQTAESAAAHIYYQRYASAVKELKSIIQQNKATPYVWYMLGEVYLSQGKIEAAEKVFNQGIEKAVAGNIPKKSAALLYVGQAHYLLLKGETDKARKLMEELLELTKYKNADVLIAVARANADCKNGDKDWALALLEKAKKRTKNKASVLLVAGDVYRTISNGSMAVTFYNHSLAEDPSLAEACYKMGLIYKTQKNTKAYAEQFTKAVAVDSAYAPALYELYYYYFFRDIGKAGQLLPQYIRHSDPSIQHQYMTTDYLYAVAAYKEALQAADELIKSEGNEVQPRLYKLIAYSKAALMDSTDAFAAMKKYFTYQDTAEYVARDYLLMAQLSEFQKDSVGETVQWYKRALAAEDKSEDSLQLMQHIAFIYKKAGDRAEEAIWRQQIIQHKENPNNLDLYNWGVALYMAGAFQSADSVFGMYTAKYPEQVHGPLWQARCNALIDTSMEMGLAVPHYKKLIEVAATDTVANKTYLLTAYGYLASFEANVTKDYEASLLYFEKMLALDPDNKDALRYTGILKKWIDEDDGTK
ncbi:MAG: tetratricopeptide repeat protein [Chitinophagaceae bacterium]|nr:tetratricopeptide repeat protein [Chitinophagaceae bacterium]